MSMRWWLVCLFVLAQLAAGCVPKWTVIQQAEPNPFVGKSEFAVAPADFSELRVGEKTEAQYLAEKDDGQRASFAGDKQAIDELFFAELRSEASAAGLQIDRASKPAPFVIRPIVQFIEPGFYAVVASAPSQVRMRVLIETADGTVLDIIELLHQTDSASSGWSVGGISTNPSSGGRLRDDASWIGEAVGEYLVERARPPE